MPVSMENLTVKARQTAEGLVLGSKIAHADIRFSIDGASSTFKLDDWINDRPAALQCRAAINGPTIPAGVAQRVLEHWTCYDSIFGEYLGAEFFPTVNIGNFFNPDNDAEFSFPGFGAGVQANFTPDQIQLFKLLAVGQAAIYWRERTAAALNIESVLLTLIKPKAREESTLSFNWTSLLRSLRKSMLATAKRNTDVYTYNDDGQTVLDTLIFDHILDAAGGFRSLHKNGIMYKEPHGNGYCFRSTPSVFLGISEEVSRKFNEQIHKALNHIRFIVYAEWRIAHQLIQKNA